MAGVRLGLGTPDMMIGRAGQFLGHGNGRLITAGVLGGAALMGGASAMQRMREQRYGSAALSAGMGAAAGYAGYMAAFEKSAFRGHIRNASNYALRTLDRMR